jgi:hypothetical protein
MLWAWFPRAALSQTPSPLQEWQYSSGVPLIKLFKPDLPDWQVELGVAAAPRPLYDGARTYRVVGGPVIDVQYRDIAFASVGEGLGVNLLRGEHFRAGVSIDYDLGRRASDDLTHLKGLGNISAAPVMKVFGSYLISKEFPLVLRADVRRSSAPANRLRCERKPVSCVGVSGLHGARRHKRCGLWLQRNPVYQQALVGQRRHGGEPAHWKRKCKPDNSIHRARGPGAIGGLQMVASTMNWRTRTLP